jgi:hypothetical protein
VKRMILGILNVINDNNYKKMVVKTKIMITQENIKEIITEILDKCVYQIFYLSIYSSLIKDLMNSFSEAEKLISQTCINNFFSIFLNQGYILEHPKSADVYHDFCIVQKNKMKILSKNLMLLDFLQTTKYINVITLANYSTLIYDAFMIEIKTDIDKADVLLQILFEMSKRNIIFDVEGMKAIKTSPKLQFMLDDIISGATSRPRPQTMGTY